MASSVVNRAANEMSEEEEFEEEDEEEEDDDNRMLAEPMISFTQFKPVDHRSLSSANDRIVGHKCPSCAKIFTTNNLMVQHFSAVHEKKRFACEYCQETFAYRSGRTRHIHSVHQKLRFRCTLCKLTYTSRETAQMHVKTKHRIKDKIDFYLQKLSGGAVAEEPSPKNANNMSNGYQKHAKRVETVVKVETPSKKDFAALIARSNGTALPTVAEKPPIKSETSTSSPSSTPSKERLKCFLCDKTFAYNAGRSKHIRIVHMNVRYRCMLCQSAYTTRDYAVQHVSSAHCIESKHPSEYVERVQDDVPQPTNATLDNSVNVDVEFDEDADSRDVAENFVDEDETGVYVEPMAVNNEFASSSTPNGGGNNLPFHCLQCGVGYETQDNLIYHVNLEHEEQKIVCDYCGKSMLRPASLVGHMKEMHKDISYRCSLCGSVFACPSLGSYHIEAEHQCDPAEHLEHVPTGVNN